MLPRELLLEMTTIVGLRERIERDEAVELFVIGAFGRTLNEFECDLSDTDEVAVLNERAIDFA